MAASPQPAAQAARRPAGVPLMASALARPQAWRQQPAHLAVASPP